jgi:hypothetical protein
MPENSIKNAKQSKNNDYTYDLIIQYEIKPIRRTDPQKSEKLSLNLHINERRWNPFE